MEEKWDRIDLSTLWDFSNPALSEERFRAALAGASEDEILLLQTQIARTYGIRREFAKAQQILFDNLGYALHLLSKYEEALEEFNKALTEQEQGGNAQAIRVAHWMIAWTLRAMGRFNEALEIQLRLKRECDDAGEPDPHVLEEIVLLENAIKTTKKS